MTIKPLADRVLILPAPAEEKTIGGIIIPDTAKKLMILFCMENILVLKSNTKV